MAFQNFNDDGWQETDSAGDLTRNGDQIDVVTMRRDANSWIERSFGANHFGDFEHDFVVRLEDANPSLPNAACIWIVWAVNDVAGTFSDLTASGDGMIALLFPGTSTQIAIRDMATVNADLFGGLVEEKTYYCTIRRYSAGTVLEMKIYNDVTKTSLIDTISVVSTAGFLENFQPCGSHDAGGASAAHEVTGFSKDYDLHEATDPQRLAAYVNPRQTVSYHDRHLRARAVYANDNWTAM